MKIRNVSDADHRLVRDLRLAALRDSPGSFGESEREASQKTESYWRDLTHSLTSTHVMFVAEIDGEAHGSVYGLRDTVRSDGARVAGMWVESSHRRRGLGRALLRAVVQWARAQEFAALRLWVPENSPAACALYSGLGFCLHGDDQICRRR